MAGPDRIEYTDKIIHKLYGKIEKKTLLWYSTKKYHKIKDEKANAWKDN